MVKEVKGTLRRRQKQETYRLILKNAKELFEAEGYTRTTIRGIAARAGIGLGTLYKHFKQKSSVLAAAFYEDIGGVLEEAIRTIPEHDHLKEPLMHLAKALYGFYADNLRLAEIYFSRIALITGEGSEYTDKLDERFLSVIVSLVEEAKQRGEVREDIDCGLVAFSFFSGYMMAIGVCFFKCESFSLDSALLLLDQTTELLINGITA